MNEKRRRKLDKIICKLEAILDEEQESFDNLPDSLQFSERGDRMQNIDNLEMAIDSLAACRRERLVLKKPGF